MSEQMHGVVVSHGSLAEMLVDTVKTITGESGFLHAVSNSGSTPDELCARIADAVGEGHVIVFVDMPAGSCMRAALTELRERSDVTVVSGVNLPMLLDFVHHRSMGVGELAARLVERGQTAIQAHQP